MSPASTAAANRSTTSRSRVDGGIAACSGDAISPWARERRPRPLQRTLHRRLRAAQDVGDLGRREAEHVAQHEHAALARRQVLEGRDERQSDRLGRFVAGLGPERDVADAVEQHVRVRLQPYRLAEAGGLGRLDHRSLLRTASAVAQRVQAPVGRDAVQPDTQRGALLEPIQAAPRRDEGLLHQVLRVLQ